MSKKESGPERNQENEPVVEEKQGEESQPEFKQVENVPDIACPIFAFCLYFPLGIAAILFYKKALVAKGRNKTMAFAVTTAFQQT